MGYGPILGDEALRRAVRGEMEFVYRFDHSRRRGLQGTTTNGDVSAGEEGTVTGTDTVTEIDRQQQEEHRGPPTWEEVAITAGCNQAFFDVMMGVCERGARVVLPVPWVSRRATSEAR